MYVDLSSIFFISLYYKMSYTKFYHWQLKIVGPSLVNYTSRNREIRKRKYTKYDDPKLFQVVPK